jgi:hypothetical protein
VDAPDCRGAAVSWHWLDWLDVVNMLNRLTGDVMLVAFGFALGVVATLWYIGPPPRG